MFFEIVVFRFISVLLFTDIEIPCYSSHVRFPIIEKDIRPVKKEKYDFNSLDRNTQDQLLEIVEQDTFTRFVNCRLLPP